MKSAPDSPSLLDDVLAESVPADGSLGTLLQAVRARQLRRRLASAVASAFTLIATLLWVSSTEYGTEQSPELAGTPASNQSDLATQSMTVRSLPHSVNRIATAPLGEGERMVTTVNPSGIALVRTQAESSLHASDEELFALAGGRGVALARLEDGRARLLFAGNQPPLN